MTTYSVISNIILIMIIIPRDRMARHIPLDIFPRRHIACDVMWSHTFISHARMIFYFISYIFYDQRCENNFVFDQEE